MSIAVSPTERARRSGVEPCRAGWTGLRSSSSGVHSGVDGRLSEEAKEAGEQETRRDPESKPWIPSLVVIPSLNLGSLHSKVADMLICIVQRSMLLDKTKLVLSRVYVYTMIMIHRDTWTSLHRYRSLHCARPLSCSPCVPPKE